MKPSPSSADTIAHHTKPARICQSHTYRAVVTASVTVPSRNETRRPQESATMPVGISNSTMPAVKNAFAVKASKFVSPASSRKIVLMPQMNDAAKVVPAVSP